MEEKPKTPLLLPIISKPKPKTSKPILWIIALTASIYSIYTLQFTHVFTHYSLSKNYNLPILIPTLSLLHFSLYLLSRYTPSGYLIDPARPLHLSLHLISKNLDIFGMILVMQPQKLNDDKETVIMYSFVAVWLLCLLKAAAPGFGKLLPKCMLGVGFKGAIRCSMVSVFMPFFLGFQVVELLME